MTAVVILFPSPQELRKTVQFQKPAASPERVELSQRHGPSEVIVTYDPAAECLVRYPDGTTGQIGECIDTLYRAILTEGTARGAEGVTELDDQLENERVALTKLCRARWAASNGDPASLESDACRFALSELAY